MPNASKDALDVMQAMMLWCPEKRPTAAACLKFPYFASCVPTPTKVSVPHAASASRPAETASRAAPAPAPAAAAVASAAVAPAAPSPAPAPAPAPAAYAPVPVAAAAAPPALAQRGVPAGRSAERRDDDMFADDLSNSFSSRKPAAVAPSPKVAHRKAADSGDMFMDDTLTSRRKFVKPTLGSLGLDDDDFALPGWRAGSGNKSRESSGRQRETSAHRMAPSNKLNPLMSGGGHPGSGRRRAGPPGGGGLSLLDGPAPNAYQPYQSPYAASPAASQQPLGRRNWGGLEDLPPAGKPTFGLPAIGARDARRGAEQTRYAPGPLPSNAPYVFSGMQQQPSQARGPGRSGSGSGSTSSTTHASVRGPRYANRGAPAAGIRANTVNRRTDWASKYL